MLITVQDIAEDICEDIGDTTQKYFTTILKKVLQGYRELHLFVTPQVNIKSVILTCDRVIPLPKDFVYQTKVGLKRGDNIANLFLDKNLRISPESRFKMSEADTQLNNILDGLYIDGLISVPFYNVFRGQEFYGELYGLGNGYHEAGYYNIDATERTVLLSHGMLPKDCELIIEYKSDGIPDGLKLIPTECDMAVRYFAKFQFNLDRDVNKANYFMNLFRTEYNRLKDMYNKRPIDFLGEVFVENHKSSPK